MYDSMGLHDVIAYGDLVSIHHYIPGYDSCFLNMDISTNKDGSASYTAIKLDHNDGEIYQTDKSLFFHSLSQAPTVWSPSQMRLVKNMPIKTP